MIKFKAVLTCERCGAEAEGLATLNLGVSPFPSSISVTSAPEGWKYVLTPMFEKKLVCSEKCGDKVVAESENKVR